MGGAIGEAIFAGGQVMSTAASWLGKDSAEKAYYRSLAKTAEEQARQAQETARRNAEYTFQDAAFQNQQLGQEYSNLLGQQKTMLAASGVSSNSATAQLILKNSRLNAQLDQDMLVKNMNRSIYETTLQGDLEAAQYRSQAKQYNAIRRNRNKWYERLNSYFDTLLKK